MSKIITLSGLKQADGLSTGEDCTPVEDVTLAGDKVIRCKEDIAALEKSAPPKVATLSGVRKPHKRSVGHRLGSTDRPCVPEWVAMRTKHGKTVRRCHCRNGRFMKNVACARARRG